MARRDPPIQVIARGRWLDNEDVFELLCNFEAHGLAPLTSPIQKPPSGTLCVYDKRVVKSFRQDGVNFIKRPDRHNAAKESHMKLKLGDTYAVKVSYASCEPDETGRSFFRRIYSRLDVADSPYVLVHYLLAHRHSRRKRMTKQGSSKSVTSTGSAGAAVAAKATPKAAAAPAAAGTLKIAAFTPNWDTSNGGAKVMVCLSGDPLALSLLCQAGHATTCQFGVLSVPATWIQPGVLICHAPMHTAGVVPFYVLHNGLVVSDEGSFQYCAPAHMPYLSAPTAGRQGMSDPRYAAVIQPATRAASPSAAPPDDLLDLFSRDADDDDTDMLGLASSLTLDEELAITAGDVNMWPDLGTGELSSAAFGLDSPVPPPVPAVGHPKPRPQPGGKSESALRAERVRGRAEPHRDRQTKIRIVERLAVVENSLQGKGGDEGSKVSEAGADEAMSASATTPTGDSYPYLDDAALEGMSDERLETLTERLLEHVINQLTQHASVEESLMQELITADVNGMTMLHYTCMYSYPKLVPVLLANGADPNKPSAAGQSPLHLAASNGHIDIARQLLHAGASAIAVDRSGLTPAQRATRNGFHELAAELESAASSQSLVAGIAMSAGKRRSQHGAGAGEGSPSRYARSLPGSQRNPGSTTAMSSPTSSTDMSRSWPLDVGASAGGSPLGTTLPRPPVPGSGDDEGKETDASDETRKMLLNAFSNMTLHDKCAISLVMNDPGQASTNRARSGSEDLFGAVGGLRDSDVASVLSDNESWLGQAMTLMSDEEKLSLEVDARRIQTNVRSWLLRRNYRNMRDAALKLQAATRGMLVRKSFEVHKHKAFAALVIQRATRSWLKAADLASSRLRMPSISE